MKVKMNVNSVETFYKQQLGYGSWRWSEGIVSVEENEFVFPISSNKNNRLRKIYACSFGHRQNSHLLAMGNSDGTMLIHNVACDDRINAAKHNDKAIHDLCWLDHSRQVVTVSGDQNIVIYDVYRCDITPISHFSCDVGNLRTVAPKYDCKNSFVTGGTKGNIQIWDGRVHWKEPILRCLHSNELCARHNEIYKRMERRRGFQCHNKSITGLAWKNDEIISSAANDASLKIWDMRYLRTDKGKIVPKYVIRGNDENHGYSSITLDHPRNILFASCFDNTIQCYDIGTANTAPSMTYKGHTIKHSYMKMCLVKKGAFLVHGSDDGEIFIWNVQKPDPVAILYGHERKVNSVAWLEMENKLVSCSDDSSYTFWTLERSFDADNKSYQANFPVVSSVNTVNRLVQKNQKMMRTRKKITTLCSLNIGTKGSLHS